MQKGSKKPGKSSTITGFTLIELALVVLILAILSTIAMPGYLDYTEKARLTDLQLRVDAMRTAMSGAYQSGDRSMLVKGAGRPGEIPDSLSNIPLRDSMTYPGLEMMLIVTDQQFGRYSAGIMRPYLVLAAGGTVLGAGNNDSARTLRNFSEIYPTDRQEWWVPSTAMVIPLLDDSTLGVSSPAATQTPPPTTAVAGTSSANTVQAGAQNTGSNPPVTSTGPATAQSNTPPPAQGNTPPAVQAFTPPATQTCVHPGNGHAWGRCGGHH